jgi:hypothetical protein
MENQTNEHLQSNFSLPHDVVPLPSKGIFYKIKKKSIKVCYLTANDENLLMAGGDDMTQNLLRSKIYEPDLRIEDMLEGDVEAVLIFLRNTAFGPEMELTLTDPVTRKPFKSTILLDQLSISQGNTPNEDGTFITTLPKSNSTVKLRPMTYGEIIENQRIIDSYPSGRTPPKVTLRLQKEIIEVNGLTDKGEIAKFIEQMPILDSKYIRNFMDENEPKLDMKRVITAPSGEKLTVNVGFGVDFFRPFF